VLAHGRSDVRVDALHARDLVAKAPGLEDLADAGRQPVVGAADFAELHSTLRCRGSRKARSRLIASAHRIPV
jgi:hypothetical protein